jgi:ankyrin repeat protein
LKSAIGTMNIIEAAQVGDFATIRQLLGAGTSIEAQDESGRTALHWVCQGGETDLVAFLLEHGANPNTADDEGFTPLAVACGENRPSIVRRLLKAGADPNARIQALEDGTVLHQAASWNHSDVCVELLQCSNIDIGIRDLSGMTAIDFALDAGATRIFELLANHMNSRANR